MTEITINRTCAIIDRCEQFTSGRVGARIKFLFSAEWAGLNRTAVFTNGDTIIDVLNVGDECIIPHEVLAISGKKLKVGVYGFTADDNGNIEIAIPTVYAELGKVVKGADPSGNESTEPSLPVWAQIQSDVNDLDDRVTELEEHGGGGEGTSDHTQLTNRDAANQHPISAITGLQTALDGKQPSGDYATSGKLDALADIVDGKADAADIPSLAGYATEAYVQNYHDNTKQDVISDIATIRSGAALGATAIQPEAGKGLFSGSFNDLTDKPTIPVSVTEQTVSGWGFTKNTGTYSKPSGGIPKADLASDIQTSLGKANTALQEHQSLAGYAMESWVTGKGYQTETQVKATIEADSNIKANTSARHSHGNKSVLDGITTQKVTEWNSKSNFSGSYNDLTDKPEALIVTVTDNNGTLTADKTYLEIWDAIVAGTTVLVNYDGTLLPLIGIAPGFMDFGIIVCVNEDSDVIVGTSIIEITQNGEVNDISAYIEKLPNPNALTFTGAVTGTYDGSSAMTVKIPSAVTDAHINSLIDAKLGVIENGSY